MDLLPSGRGVFTVAVVVGPGARSTLLLVPLPCFSEKKGEEVSEVRLKTLRIRFRKGMFRK